MTDLDQSKKIILSIITVCYNSARHISEAINSVICQDFLELEYILIDGASTDGTKEIIKKYAENNPNLIRFFSEKDAGIYDAMNKGIDKARGNWLYFLGADDQLHPNILDNVRPYFGDAYRVVFGNVVFDNGSCMTSFLGSRTLWQNTLHHQSAFYHRSNFKKFRYDISLKILADYELNLLIYLRKMPLYYVPLVIACCNTGGASSKLMLSWLETNKVRKRYVKNILINMSLSITLGLYYIQKKIRYILYGHRV